jgi:heme/copper-type cytochrome/quinol oxidase subunit 2
VNRAASIVLVAGTLSGALLITAFDAYREPLESWIVADPARAASRARLLLGITATLMILPLFAFAVYVRRLADRSDDARQARGLRAIAIFLLVAGALLIVMFWRFALLLRS